MRRGLRPSCTACMVSEKAPVISACDAITAAALAKTTSGITAQAGAILKNGFAIVYTPTAVCWHRHRRTERELLTTLYGYSVGVYSVLFRCIADDDDWTALRAGLGWFANHHVRNAIRGLLRRPDAIPLRYTASEIRGVLAAFSAYRKTRRIERESARAYAVDKELA